MKIVVGTSDTLSQELMGELARYRHRVFVERLGWELACEHGIELDQFDRHDTLYLAALRSDGDLVGTARLLPTTQPYLLGEIFPELMGVLPAPNSPFIWELSRFASVDLESANTGSTHQFSWPITLALLHEVLSQAKYRGVRRLITVSPLGVERLLNRAGVHSYRAGPPMVIGGHPLFACWIRVPGK